MKNQICFFALLFLASCQFINPKQVGTWEGTNYANQKISFIFKDEKEVVLTFGNETAQGTYKINENKTPNWIDIYPVDAKNAIGIIEFMDNNTFRIQLVENKERPQAFDQNKQLILKKVE